MLLAAAIERLYDLRVGITPVEEGTPHERPHKPLLLLAAFDLIDDDLAGLHSIRINDQWRMVFHWTADGPAEVRIVDYH